MCIKKKNIMPFLVYEKRGVTSSDSDCVIIPRSSFTGKELVLFDSSIAAMFTKSKFHSPDSIHTLRGGLSSCLAPEGNATSL
jgi:hypothetical protein